MTRIGDRIRIMRERRSWSMNELGERAGVSHTQISRIEKGESSPTWDLLLRVSSALGISIAQLVVGTNPDNFHDDELLEMWRALNDEERQTVRRIMDLFYRDGGAGFESADETLCTLAM